MRLASLLAIPIAVLCAEAAMPQAPTTISVQLSNYKFTPKTIVLNHGQSYVLRLQNVAGGGHDFTAPAFFAAARVAPEDRRMVAEGEVEVHPGQVHEIHLVAPAGAGSYKLKCSHSFHKMFGMSGTIIVR